MIIAQTDDFTHRETYIRLTEMLGVISTDCNNHCNRRTHGLLSRVDMEKIRQIFRAAYIFQIRNDPLAVRLIMQDMKAARVT